MLSNNEEILKTYVTFKMTPTRVKVKSYPSLEMLQVQIVIHCPYIFISTKRTYWSINCRQCDLVLKANTLCMFRIPIYKSRYNSLLLNLKPI